MLRIISRMSTRNPTAAQDASIGQSRERTAVTFVNDAEVIAKALDELDSSNDSLFWLIYFVCPAAAAMCGGIVALAWKEHTLRVAIVVTVGLSYCIVQVSRVVGSLAKAWKNMDAQTTRTDHA